MKINRPGSPLGGGSEPLEPLDPRDLTSIIKAERFSAVLNELEGQSQGTEAASQTTGSNAAGATSKKAQATRSELEKIARSVNLSDPEQAQAAVKQSAGTMVRYGLAENYREHPQAERIISELGSLVAADPMLKSRLLTILTKLQQA